ncbi:hypothetical protein DIR76_26190, partial [Salmonella enterica subsp. enterica serovar Poano]|nr:hypothetical protein [Salmonella enterica subsp. enterica serovar Poano]
VLKIEWRSFSTVNNWRYSHTVTPLIDKLQRMPPVIKRAKITKPGIILAVLHQQDIGRSRLHEKRCNIGKVSRTTDCYTRR